MNKTASDIMALWEQYITDDTTPEEKTWLIDKSCSISSKLIILQMGGYSYQEAIDEVYNRELDITKYYTKGIGYKHFFDDSIMYMYPERITTVQTDISGSIGDLPSIKDILNGQKSVP